MRSPSSTEAVDVIVVTRDRFSTFARCLDAVYHHTHLPCSLFVVAGAVDRATEEHLRRVQATKGNVSLLLENRHLTQAEARNLGLAQARSRYCVVLENDTMMHDNWLAPMLECMREQRAAAVMPLIFWYRGLHAAGCTFEELDVAGRRELRHRILYGDIRRKPIGYPESHCVLIDRHLLDGDVLFDDVEPFDVDLGLTLRKRGLSVFLEPRAVATYAAPPPLELRDIPLCKRRWDASAWKARNDAFMEKWDVYYDAAHKLASYRRQELKLGLARWYETPLTVALSNLAFASANRLLSVLKGTSSEQEPRH